MIESESRLDKLDILKNNNIIVYGTSYSESSDIDTINQIDDEKVTVIESVSGILSKEESEYIPFSTSGRIYSSRGGGNLKFFTLEDETGSIQLAFKKGSYSFNDGKNIINDKINLSGNEIDLSKFIEKYIDLGDFIGVKGRAFTNKNNARILAVEEFKFLGKSLIGLPEKFHGIKEENRFNNQVEWLISNREARERIRFRNEFVWQLRNFYYKNGFEEIETPILSSSASGAAAKPFITHHEDFNQEFYLRIAKETKMKMAMAAFSGGKFFEIAKDFRNEGSGPNHMQEFTMIEHYRKNWTNDDNILFVKDMLNHIFSTMKLDKVRDIADNDGNIKQVDFSKEFESIDYIEGIKDISGIDIMYYLEGDEEILIKDIKNKGYNWKGMENMGVSTLIDYLFKKVLRPSIINPTIVRNYPRFMQPFARQLDSNGSIVDQAQLIINGVEILKMYTELTDPIIQKENFDNQLIAIEKGDEEAIEGDKEFLNAMKQGMPPMAGLGMGIERIVSMLLGTKTLKDVTLFPVSKK